MDLICTIIAVIIGLCVFNLARDYTLPTLKETIQQQAESVSRHSTGDGGKEKK